MDKVLKAIEQDEDSKRHVDSFFKKFDSFMKKHHIQYENDKLFLQAFMHSSFVYNIHLDRIHSNERLEFLGDAVLELMVSEYIFDAFKDFPEGDLTKLRANIVCEPSLVIFANDLKMEELLLLGPGEKKTGGKKRPSIISDMFEAFLGALYLDQGYDAVWKFLSVNVFPKIERDDYLGISDFKTALQEFVHKAYKEEVYYHLLEETGPSHDKNFVSNVTLNDKEIGRGSGRSKKESEQLAAKVAFYHLKEKAER
ncbi:ribonuclease III [Nosocomiicoccus massiliensis]|uniref:ribonuclease III n=1 Tax=Nosocomiicoccus massiliensis TaxID=1232430 RepID=UPI00040EA233|nr:ribonuclease III [Nosocomiicoccus massiliensis]